MIIRILPNGTTEIDLSDEDLPIGEKIDIIKRLLNNEVIIKKRRKAKFMYSKKYPIKVYNFIKDNIKNMTNQELIQAIKKEFNIEISYSQLADYTNYSQISRKGL